MNKIFKALATTALGLALAFGVGVGVASGVRTDEVSAYDSTFTKDDVNLRDATTAPTGFTFTKVATYCGSKVSAGKTGTLDISYSTSDDLSNIDFSKITSSKLTVILGSGRNSGSGGITVKLSNGSSLNKESGVNNSSCPTFSNRSSTKVNYEFNNPSAFTSIQITSGAKYYLISFGYKFEYTAVTEDVPLTDIGLPSTASVQVGSTTTLTPIKTPTNANKNDTLSWESLDPTYASVNQSGVVSGLKEGTARIRVNATDIGKSATCTVTVSPVPPVPVTHTIADCYSVNTGTTVKFNGIYMGTYGTSVKDGIFFANGEWGILVYGYTSSIPSTWEVGKTVVAVSGKTAFYNGLIQIKDNLSFQVTSASVDSPVVYTFLGTETTADALSRKSSIAGTITAITGQTSGKFVTGTDGKVTVDLGDEKSATIFIKKGAHTQTELDEYSEKFKVGAYVAVTGFLNYYDKDTSFKGTYNPTKFQIIVPKISAMEKYTAVKFSQDFLTATDPICSSSGDNHLAQLQAIWTDLGANYTLLDSAERANLADTSATDTDIVSAIARYKYICGKYNTETVKNLEEFIEGVVIVYNAPNVFFGVNSTDNNTMMIVIISVAVASISLLGVTIFLKKKRAIH